MIPRVTHTHTRGRFRRTCDHVAKMAFDFPQKTLALSGAVSL